MQPPYVTKIEYSVMNTPWWNHYQEWLTEGILPLDWENKDGRCAVSDDFVRNMDTKTYPP